MTNVVNPLDDDEPEAEKPKAEKKTSSRPVPETQLTPDQLRIRDLEDQLAKAQGNKDVEPTYEEPANPGSEENILIHFLEDGFTALGQVWFKGQEIEFTPGSQAYEDTKDRNGKTWLDLRNDEFAQVDRYGKIMFRSGPWPGKDYAAAAGSFAKLKALSGDGVVAGPSEAELYKAAEMERARRRAAPTLPKL